MEQKRTILHVDLNSFFATAEQQANPNLRGKPVGVLKAKGRTCVIAASIEAKKYGVKTGMSVFDAQKVCPNIVLVDADFDKYSDITFRFIDICKSYSPICEVFSLDECFIDITQAKEFWIDSLNVTNLEHLARLELGRFMKDDKSNEGVLNIAFDIKRRLRDEIGDYMQCSIGISHNKLLSKLASSQIKDDGFFWITDRNKLDILDKSSLMDVCGLGFGLYNHLIKLSIDDFVKLRSCSLDFLYKNFGPFWSKHLYDIARGIDNIPVVSIADVADAKSVGRTYTTHKNLATKNEVLKLIRNLCEEAAEKARLMGLFGRYIGLTLRGGSRQELASYGWPSGRNFSQSWYGHRTLKEYICDGKRFFEICCEIYKEWPVFSVRFCGVTLGMLTCNNFLPIPLFPKERRRQALIRTVDDVNSKYGHYTLFPGQLLGMPLIMPEVNGFFGDKKFRLDFLRKS